MFTLNSSAGSGWLPNASPAKKECRLNTLISIADDLKPAGEGRG